MDTLSLPCYQQGKPATRLVSLFLILLIITSGASMLLKLDFTAKVNRINTLIHTMSEEEFKNKEISTESRAEVDKLLAEALEFQGANISLFWFVIILSFGGLVTFCYWIYRMNKNTRVLGINGLKYTPFWAAAWNLVPLLFFWKPFLAVKEIWQANLPGTDWRQNRLPLIFFLWWFSFILLAVAGMSSLLDNPEFTQIDEIIYASTTFTILYGIKLIYTALTLAVVIKIQQAQNQIYAAEQIRLQDRTESTERVIPTASEVANESSKQP